MQGTVVALRVSAATKKPEDAMATFEKDKHVMTLVNVTRKPDTTDTGGRRLGGAVRSPAAAG